MITSIAYYQPVHQMMIKKILICTAHYQIILYYGLIWPKLSDKNVFLSIQKKDSKDID